MDPSQLPWSEGEIRIIRTRLVAFFQARRRPLPWRESPSPYGILVSEVMSQQTRLSTVVPYYRRWMERFPNPAALAAADTQEVLSLWEGLGYYSRARNLHRAARELEARYGGRVPSDPDELRTLPGVGPYTAGAVASIAFGLAEPAVDGNVRRVLARLLDAPDPPPRRLRTWAAALVDPRSPGEFNQGLMELGSLVCTPRSPACARCPLEAFCGARAAGTQEERPAPKRRAPVARVEEGVLVLVRPADELVLLRRRPPEGLLGGMWELPGSRVRAGEGPRAAALRAWPEQAGAGAEACAEETRALGLPPVRHVFSHLEVTYHPFVHAVRSAAPPAAGSPRWVAREEAASLPIPVAQRRILRAAVSGF